jgi:hypothetical protein
MQTLLSIYGRFQRRAKFTALRTALGVAVTEVGSLRRYTDREGLLAFVA